MLTGCSEEMPPAVEWRGTELNIVEESFANFLRFLGYDTRASRNRRIQRYH